MNKRILYAYMAGFIDADGYISIISQGTKAPFVPKVAVTNTNIKVIELFKTEFGGKIRARTRDNFKWKTCYEWSLTSKKGIDVIKKLKKYLFLKKKQAELTLETYKVMDYYGHIILNKTKKANKLRKLSLLKNKCLELNKRGTWKIITEHYVELPTCTKCLKKYELIGI